MLERSNGVISCDATPPVENSALPVPFGVIGVSYRTASLELRSALAVSPDSIPDVLRSAKQAGVSECVVLSTCNRTEIYFAGSDSDVAMRVLADWAGLPIETIQSHIYLRPCVCAACHLFRVTAGLDSAVLGESDIVAQVKEAWVVADRHEAVGPVLDLLFKRAMEASKRIRTETDLCRQVTSTGTLAVRRVRDAIGSLEDARLLIVGAGMISMRIAKELKSSHAQNVAVLNRTIERGQILAKLVGAESLELRDLEEELVKADAVFTAVTVESPIIDSEVLARVAERRDGKPLLFIDLGMPSNVQSDDLPVGFSVVDIDQLSQAKATNTEKRDASIMPALELLDEELRRFGSVLVERAAAPTIRALLAHGDEVRARNLQWAMDKLPDLTAREARIIEDLAKRIVLGLLEAPIQNLKANEGAQEHRHLIEYLFSLDGGLANRSS